MTTKKKLKRKLRRQKTAHILTVSDLNIELDKVRYSLTFAEAQVSQLQYQNELLQAMIDRLTQEPNKEEIQNEVSA
jgi:hypothetical protein